MGAGGPGRRQVALNLDRENVDLETAYAGLAEAWASDATLAYGPLARHLVARAPFELRGVRALDAGAGSGVAGEALRTRGARVVAADREFDMASHARLGPAVTADVTALPFRDRRVRRRRGGVRGQPPARPGGGADRAPPGDPASAARCSPRRSRSSGRRPRARWTRWRRRTASCRPGGTPTSRSARRPSATPALGRAGACGGRVRPLERHRGAGRRRADRARRRGALPARGCRTCTAFACPLSVDARERVRGRRGRGGRAGPATGSRRSWSRPSQSPERVSPAADGDLRNAGPCSAASRATCSASRVGRGPGVRRSGRVGHVGGQPPALERGHPGEGVQVRGEAGLVDRLAEPCLRGRPDQPGQHGVAGVTALLGGGGHRLRRVERGRGVLLGEARAGPGAGLGAGRTATCCGTTGCPTRSPRPRAGRRPPPRSPARSRQSATSRWHWARISWDPASSSPVSASSSAAGSPRLRRIQLR